ncbi:hypothetical protein [Helicobacter sp. T3_23-1056]
MDFGKTACNDKNGKITLDCRLDCHADLANLLTMTKSLESAIIAHQSFKPKG